MRQFQQFAVCAVCLLLTQEVAGQQVHGSLREDGSEAAVAAALIILLDSTGTPRHQVFTDSLGNFSMMAAAAGTYRLGIERIGYAAVQSEPFSVSRGDTVHFQLYLTARAVRLEPLVVSGRPASRLDVFYERRRRFEKLGIGDFFGPSELEPWTNHSVSAVLQSVPYLNANSGSMGRLSRSRRCQIAYYIDGVRLRSLFGQSVDQVLRVIDLEGIEVYRGQAQLPAEYSDAQSRGCPVVAFWTRRGVTK
jgi:hypothetical protein